MHEKLKGLINKYRMLRAERDAGRISDEEYKRQLEGSAIADPQREGCWWNISPESGLWIYFDGKEWTQRAPAGYDPMVSGGAPVTAARPAAKGGNAWVWILVAALAVVLLTAGGITIALMLSRGGGSAASPDVESRIEDALDEFLDAAGKGEYKDVKDLVTGRLADDLKESQDAGEIKELLRIYDGAKTRADDIQIDGNEAEARIELRKDGERFEQTADLELVGGRWMIAKLSRVKQIVAQEGRREPVPIVPTEQGGEAEPQIRAFLNEFLEAFRNYDINGMRGMLSGQALEELAQMEEVSKDPEQLAAVKEYMQQLTWEIRNLQIERGGDRATAVIYLNLVEKPQNVTLERGGGGWRIVKIEEEGDSNNNYDY
jgi:hypothetical protein